MIEAKVSNLTIYRLSAYLRVLTQFEKKKVTTITSAEIGKMVCVPDNQVRKDLTLFGEFGISGTGYRVRELKEELCEILGVDKKWEVILIGVGKLGAALLGYPGFEEEGFKFVAAFDKKEKKIGKYCNGLLVQDIKRLADVIKENKVKMGIITVPAKAAQGVANKLVESGIECILNFAPTRIRVPPNVKLRNIDLASELVLFSYFLVNRTSIREG